MAFHRTKFEDLTSGQRIVLVVLFPLWAVITIVGLGIDWLGDIMEVVEDGFNKDA